MYSSNCNHVRFDINEFSTKQNEIQINLYHQWIKSPIYILPIFIGKINCRNDLNLRFSSIVPLSSFSIGRNSNFAWWLKKNVGFKSWDILWALDLPFNYQKFPIGISFSTYQVWWHATLIVLVQMFKKITNARGLKGFQNPCQLLILSRSLDVCFFATSQYSMRNQGKFVNNTSSLQHHKRLRCALGRMHPNCSHHSSRRAKSDQSSEFTSTPRTKTNLNSIISRCEYLDLSID